MEKRRIQVLPEQLANKIAAGEVIQRPESLVKELMENALDAGASRIIVVVKNGGKDLVEVIDDGEGMDEQDAAASFLRHATSKIATYEDLEHIVTYGFRGEALASIAAVAHVTMKTRRRQDDMAVTVQISGGSSPRVAREGREPGTSVKVQNLFYNVPARRKFLRSTATEFRHVLDAVQRVALSHPELSLQFISDDEIILDVRPCTLQERVAEIFGERQGEGMFWFEEVSDLLSLYGFLGKPTFGHKTRAYQYVFLNRRFIVNRNINHAVFSAYEQLLSRGTFPFFLLFLDIDPRRVDVNVHPSKLEAKFEDEQAIYRFVSTAVRKYLASQDFVPALSIPDATSGAASLDLRFTDRQHRWPSWDGNARAGGASEAGQTTRPGTHLPAGGAGSAGDAVARQLLSIPEQAEMPGGAVQPDVVWQLHRKYILVPIEHGLMVIDQHVAHERILYEKIQRRFESGSLPQQLLFPHTLELSPADHSLLMELLPHLERLGFVVIPFGKHTVRVDGLPADLHPGIDPTIIKDILDLYREYGQGSPKDVRDTLAKSYSCKAAVKAGDVLNEQEMRSLVDQLFMTSMPYVCPHGRPVVLKLSIEEFDRRFGRT